MLAPQYFLFSTANLSQLSSLGDTESGFGMTVTNSDGQGSTLGVLIAHIVEFLTFIG